MLDNAFFLSIRLLAKQNASWKLKMHSFLTVSHNNQNYAVMTARILSRTNTIFQSIFNFRAKILIFTA